ncbi:MAG: phage holin family protein [Chitinophagales bacterium]
MKFIFRILFVAIISFAMANFLPGIHVDTFATALIFSVVLSVLNIFIKPLLILFTLPATILTLGLFLFVINAIIVLLASNIVNGFRIDNFWWALLFSLILSLLTSVFNKELEKNEPSDS